MPPLAMPPAASPSCPCTIPSPIATISSQWVGTGILRWGPAARVGIRAADRLASTPWAHWYPTGSRTPRPIGPGFWPGGPATPRPTSAWPPGTGSTSWTSTALPAPASSRSWPPPMTCTARGRWSGPVGVAGTSTFARPASATRIPATWRRWIGGARAAMSSPHPAATPPATTTSGSPAAPSRCRRARFPRCCWRGWNAECRNDPLIWWSFRPQASPRETAMRGRPWPRSSPASQPPQGAAQPPTLGVDPQPIQPGRHRRPRPPRGRPRAARGRRALRAAW
jgi:hypothetical protein